MHRDSDSDFHWLRTFFFYFQYKKHKMNTALAVMVFALVLLFTSRCTGEDGRLLLVPMTLVRNASASGAFCLDGSLPAYHLHRGFGSGENNWILQFEGGGWCNDIPTCLERAKTRRGSTIYMRKLEIFSGILSNNASLNPDFYNWNRVKVRYCDGASFAGDMEFNDGESVLYFKGQKIWEAIINDLLPKGLRQANQALLSGCSAGGLSAIIHCEEFTRMLPRTARVKCLSDAGFFMDVKDISSDYSMRSFFQNLVSLQGVEENLNANCTSLVSDPRLCIFPQYSLPYITTPLFILNSAYDVYQFDNILVPSSSDPHGHWRSCKRSPEECSSTQMNILQGFRDDMLEAIASLDFKKGGMFINSCFAHCQTELQDTWFGLNSPRIHNKTIAETIGDWYFNGNGSKEIDCPYPCDKTCHYVPPVQEAFCA